MVCARVIVHMSHVSPDSAVQCDCPSSNMPWSEGVVEQFETVDLYTTEESDFYGPFISLLCKRIDGSLDFTFQFIVNRRRTPVFFLEVKTFRSLTLLSARGSADDQMRQRFREFASGTISTATLYGLSAFGPKFCTRRIDPPAIARDLVLVNDTAPEARWAYNLLEPAGEAKFREVVNAVKEMTAGL
ncbi:hypothetical protein BJ912DRAFT_978519 [Pholiota molesta]|nr:hypothetical protein BJ912DRAFT_978519 [Pholiota molesta]